MMYKLVNRKPVPVPNAMSDAGSIVDGSVMLEDNRRVANDFIIDDGKRIHVSTVFLGIDHGFEDEPILFETMVFGSRVIWQERCATWDEAIAQHATVIARLLQNSKTAKLEKE